MRNKAALVWTIGIAVALMLGIAVTALAEQRGADFTISEIYTADSSPAPRTNPDRAHNKLDSFSRSAGWIYCVVKVESAKRSGGWVFINFEGAGTNARNKIRVKAQSPYTTWAKTAGIPAGQYKCVVKSLGGEELRSHPFTVTE